MRNNLLSILIGAVIGLTAGILYYNNSYAERITIKPAPVYEGVIVELPEPTPAVVELTPAEETEPTETIAIDPEDALILMRIAEAEATACSVEERAYIMAVVLNRVASTSFPDTVEAVVFQDNQFSPIKDGRYYSVELTDEDYLALAEIESGNYIDFEGLYFENCKGESWHSRNLTQIETEDTIHRFYK